ncbi:hypothetical protein JKP88DRAFT_287898 [Tribonema minus]|uniref:Uncharacterized protein n=1 Tax=Tribonema minus TaxID=303371 RepID=A0A836CLJ3_9STRA|nr:hypothetical protein JKP88DRAFT_287898 [Tribonema minus]
MWASGGVAEAPTNKAVPVAFASVVAFLLYLRFADLDPWESLIDDDDDDDLDDLDMESEAYQLERKEMARRAAQQAMLGAATRGESTPRRAGGGGA